MSKILSLKDIKNADCDLFIDLSAFCYKDDSISFSYVFAPKSENKSSSYIDKFDYYPAIFMLKDYKYDIYDDCTIYVDIIDLISGKVKLFGVEVFNQFPFMRNKETNDCENAFMKIDFFGYKLKYLKHLKGCDIYCPTKNIYFCLDNYGTNIYSILSVLIFSNNSHISVKFDKIYDYHNLNNIYLSSIEPIESRINNIFKQVISKSDILFASDDINKVRDTLKKANLLR